MSAHLELFASGPALVFGRAPDAVDVKRFDTSIDLTQAVDELVAELDPAKAPLGVLPRQHDDVVIIVLDHLVGDAEALDVLFTELAASYSATTGGCTTSESSPTPSFASFVARRRQRELAERDTALEHWRRLFDPIDLTVDLPFPSTAGHRETPLTQVARHRIDVDTATRLTTGLRDRQATVASALVSAVGGPLARAQGREHCLLGVPSSQRVDAEDVDLVGMALGVLPVVVAAEGPPEHRLREARDAMLTGRDFTTVGVAEAVRAAGGSVAGGSLPLAAWVNDLTGRRVPEGFGDGAHYIDHELARPLFPLSFYLHRVRDELELVAFTDGRLFTDTGYLEHLVGQVVDELMHLATGTSVPKVPPPAPAEPARPDAARLLAEAPGPGAVVDARHHRTPADLRRHADEIERLWRNTTTGTGEVVLVRATRDIHLLPTLLGLWQAGLTPAIVDALVPANALLRRAESVGARWQVDTTAGARPMEIPSTIDRTASVARPMAGEHHILFTSGTTGEPRPVAMALSSTLEALQDLLEFLHIGPSDRIGLTSGLGHDPMLRDLLIPHLSGAELHIPAAEVLRNPRALSDFVVDAGLTVLHATPSLMELLLAGAPDGFAAPGLRAVVCGGEPLSAWLLHRIRTRLPSVRVLNAYGCTESAQVASLLELTTEDVEAGEPPIGNACGATSVCVLRGDHMAAPGEVGEVAVIGPHVTPGVPGVHRTGDRGRVDTSGRIHLAGRSAVAGRRVPGRPRGDRGGRPGYARGGTGVGGFPPSRKRHARPRRHRHRVGGPASGAHPPPPP